MTMEGGGSRRRNGGAAAAGSESSARSAALQQLKNLRQQGGRRVDGFDLKLEEKIYDTVGEDDYAQLVAKRRAAVKDFVVDDAGLGYCDVGEEEDWEADALPYSSEEEQGASSSKKKKMPSENKKKNEGGMLRKASELSAAAALMGKQRVSSMFTSSSMFRKNNNKEEKPGSKGFSTDSILEDVLAEITPDEADREKRRRRGGAKSTTVVGNVFSNGTQSSPQAFSWKRSEFQASEESTQQKINLESSHKPKSGENDHRHDSGSGIATESQNSDHVLEEQHVAVEFPNDVTENASHKEDDFNLTKPLPAENSEIVVADNELKAKSEVVKEKNILNAIIGCENSTSKANSDWQAIWQGGDEKGAKINETLDDQVVYEDGNDLPLESDGMLLFYLIDAYEEAYGAHPGTLYLFGKVKVNHIYVSCCVVVRNMQRCVFAIPVPSVFPDKLLVELEQASKEGTAEQSSLRKKLQEMASGIKQEISQKLMDLSVTNFSMVPVKRNYAFERREVPIGEHYVLKLSYPFQDPPLPADLKGNHFSALFGTHSSALELFLIKKRIRGPAWLSISKASCLPSSSRVSWCKFEVNVESPKDIKVAVSVSIPQEIPPLVVAAINLKTMINDKHNVNEIASVSIVYCHRTKVDYPMPKAEWNKPGMLSHFSILRKLDGGIFPMGFTKDVANKNAKAGSNVLSYESSERALLNRLMIKLHQLDPDVLVGHNISGFDLDVLLHRAQTCKVPSNMWSKFGRLKRSVMPKLSKGNSSSGTGATPGVMTCIAGRLLCDTYLSSRELLKEVSYSLTQLAKNQLGRDRKEIDPIDMPMMYQTSASLLELVECAETDAWLSLGLMFHLSVLPLTRQLTNISGNLWSKTLQGARAQRVEYLLLHEFHARKFIVPDKMSARDKEITASKRKVASSRGVADTGEQVDEYGIVEDGAEPFHHGKHKKGPAYLGGLVLEPKKGLYDKYILLLDFNSLYPSIIQEYNVCFTTVERPSDGSIPNLPTCKVPGVLPQLLKNLVGRRKQVKLWLKNTSDPLKFQQLDIQQQALKLTANSMYGCLGFANSRFYAKPLAELITSQGREILQSTVDLVQNSLNLEVIYGDTDSIMIHSGFDDVTDAKMVAGRVIKEVNKKYKCLEIDLDGLYKRMLLLKKKKYAAVKVQFNKDGTTYEVIEQKGLDIVRRDWSLLSKEIGNFCLEQILSGGSCEDVVEAIHNRLQKVQEEMRSGQVELEKYVITKSLTKSPEDYPDSKNQPHVQVALRMKQSGHRIGCSVGDTVPYIICREQGSGEGTTTGIAERARHPDELKRDSGDWMIDIDYYLSQQIHPVVSRLCAPIQGTSPGRLADCLGLESSKFEPKMGSKAVTKDPATAFFCTLLNDGERYHNCEPFLIVCPHCSTCFECPSVTSMINAPEHATSTGDVEQGDTVPKILNEATEKYWYLLQCPKCKNTGDPSIISPATLSNQVKRQAEKFIALYYTGMMTCDDDMCKHTTRRLNLQVIGDTERGTVCPNYPRCNGRLVRQYTEVDLYKQLTYFCWLLDVPRILQKLEYDARIPAEKRLAKVRPTIDAAATTIREIRDRCAYGWVKLDNLVVCNLRIHA